MRYRHALPSLLTLLLFILVCCNRSDLSAREDFELKLKEIRSAEVISDKQRLSVQLWDSLARADQIPFRSDSVVYFLYRGDAGSVHWNGDFNSWGQDQSKMIEGERIPDTDLWVAREVFPEDARIDYKITLNGEQWITDPANPHIQYSGFGPNSELRMPAYREDPMTKVLPSADQGLITNEITIRSSALGYDLSYSVYTPPSYDVNDEYPVLYVTDGPEYMDQRLGALPRIADNMIHKGLIRPVIIIFVSPLDPGESSINRRADEMGMNSDYLNFFSRELIPTIDQNYATTGKAEDRGILGTSLGGLNATYFAFSRPDLFGMAAAQAPAYWFNEDIYDLVREFDRKEPVLFLSTGTINDNLEDARRMRELLLEKDLSFTYVEVNEGHSWGAWKTQLDEILRLFYGNANPGV